MSEYRMTLEKADEAVDENKALRKTLRICRTLLMAARNEICRRCGQYRSAHMGSCRGCRWE